MTAIVESLALVAKDLALDVLKNFAKEKVIERWSRYRSERFYDAFLDEVRKQADIKAQSSSLDDLLAELGNSEEASSTLFDSYRRVCLSASRDIAPRVIGLLTAEIVLERRQATEDEELVFQAAESLTDADFRTMVSYAQSAYATLTDKQIALLNEHGFTSYLIEEFDQEEIPVGGQFYMLPMFNISEGVGVWARRLESLGLILGERREKIQKVQADSELRRDEDGHIRTVSGYIETSSAFHRLVLLAERAIAST